MSNFYSQQTPFETGGQQTSQGSGSGSGSGSSGSSFYDQGGYGQSQQQQQQQGSSSGAGSSSYGGYGAGAYSGTNSSQPQQQSWHQQPAATASSGPMGGSSPAQPQQQQQQSTTAGATAPAFWNPAATAAVMSTAAGKGFSNDAMIDATTMLGQQFIASGTARLIPGLDTAMRTLRVYFAVDNRYVKAKMQRILFPFLNKDWNRVRDDAGGSDTSYALPIQDYNAFDLYIPFMGLITYVLLCALCYGTAGKFNPEVLPDIITKCFVTQILEVLAIRLGFYTMQAPASFLDLVSITGYKYLGLCINMLVALVLSHFGYGYRAYYITLLWTATAASYFVLKTMANNIPRVTAATGPKREFMVLGFAGSQFATMWFVSQTKFLS